MMNLKVYSWLGERGVERPCEREATLNVQTVWVVEVEEEEEGEGEVEEEEEEGADNRVMKGESEEGING